MRHINGFVSCAVMRGSKSGVEKRIRDENAPHLLHIDGDFLSTCARHLQGIHEVCRKTCE